MLKAAASSCARPFPPCQIARSSQSTGALVRRDLIEEEVVVALHLLALMPDTQGGAAYTRLWTLRLCPFATPSEGVRYD
jgi:hypothetical protein